MQTVGYECQSAHVNRYSLGPKEVLLDHPVHVCLHNPSIESNLSVPPRLPFFVSHLYLFFLIMSALRQHGGLSGGWCQGGRTAAYSSSRPKPGEIINQKKSRTLTLSYIAALSPAV
ncbi:hypothetical protein Q8A67_020591 [Cirrhinus molitorella]|uniref:Uncharacterized protein n=1 Tax=Cirrhinus molitorella TaxID=172907 RepID=A0AA88PAL6_9TELE|nr:hypothetical protein Q8A67_020591 [Cirrhinus molitorella]